MIATLAAAAAGGIVAALAVFALTHLVERRHRATVNVYGTTPAPAPASPANKAAETPQTHTGIHAPHTPATQRHASARQGSERYRRATVGTIIAPTATDPDDLSNLDDAALIEKGRAAIARWKTVASQYKSMAETLEASLYAARQDAETQRDRADRLQAMYVRRTQQMLHAGFTIVFDHADLGRE